MRGKDVGLRRVGVVNPGPKRALLDAEAKEFLLKFIDKLEIDVLEITKDKVDVSSSHNDYAMSPREVAVASMAYLRACVLSNQPLTKSGLGVFCGLTPDHTKTMQREPYFKDMFTRVLGFIEMYNESALHTRQNPIGAIFVLKNMGWSDNVDVTVRPAPTMTVEERLEAKKRISQFSE